MRNENKLLEINPIERHAWIWIRGGLRIEPFPLAGTVAHETGIVVAKVSGCLNFETASGFSKLLRSEPAPHLMLEMSGVDQLDSAGVGALASIFISRKRRGKSLLLANLSVQAAAALQLARLTEVLPVYSQLGFAACQFGPTDVPARPAHLELCAVAT